MQIVFLLVLNSLDENQTFAENKSLMKSIDKTIFLKCVKVVVKMFHIKVFVHYLQMYVLHNVPCVFNL